MSKDDILEQEFNACDLCLMRQFDEDVVAGKPLPDDVQQHLRDCADCREAWHSEFQFEQQLTSAMKMEPPVHVYRKAYVESVRISEERQRKHQQWLNAVQWLTIGLVTAAFTYLGIQFLPESWQFNWASYCVGAVVTGFGVAWDQGMKPAEDDWSSVRSL